MAEVERLHILATLRECAYNKTRAAKILGLSVRGLRLKLHLYEGYSAEDIADHLETIFSAFDLLPSSIAVLDPKGEVITTNRAWKAIAQSGGVTKSNRTINYIEECESASEHGNTDSGHVLNGLKSVSLGKIDHFTHIYECSIGGLIHWMQVDVVPRAVGGLVVIHNDVSSMEYDAECHLPNDRLYRAQLLHTVSESTERGSEFVCLVVTLEDTARAERIFGSGAVAETVRGTAKRLVGGLQGNQFVARIGVYEFGIIWTSPAAERDRCARQVALLLKSPILFEKKQLTGISAVVGASAFPGDGTTVQALLSAARTDQARTGRPA